jgi:hypothetical protein
MEPGDLPRKDRPSIRGWLAENWLGVIVYGVIVYGVIVYGVIAVFVVMLIISWSGGTWNPWGVKWAKAASEMTMGGRGPPAVHSRHPRWLGGQTPQNQNRKGRELGWTFSNTTKPSRSNASR